MSRSLVVSAMAALLVAGCGSGSPTTADLADDLGCELSRATGTAFPEDDDRDTGVCLLDEALVSLYTFPSQGDRDAWLGVVGASPGLAIVVGDEWAIMCDVEQAPAVADATDGEVR